MSVIGSSTKYYLLTETNTTYTYIYINGSRLSNSNYHTVGQVYYSMCTGYYEFTLNVTDTIEITSKNGSSDTSAILVRCTNDEEIIMSADINYTVPKSDSNALFYIAGIPNYGSETHTASYLNGTLMPSLKFFTGSNGYGVLFRYYTDLSSGDIITSNTNPVGKVLITQP